MQPLSLKTFKKRVASNKRKMRMFLTRLKKTPPKTLDQWAVTTEPNVWKEVDCLSCANCCKSMTPTFTNADIKRIANFLGTTANDFRKTYLLKDRTGDWMNVKQPCQFLDMKTHKCSIYAVRPSDCSGFPHLSKKKVEEYIHVHHQNIEFCPATFNMVERMMQQFK
jgi:Fe-S-cluster containining protein